jgi:alpha-tubulin suppressor-like RCC1 family protein
MKKNTFIISFILSFIITGLSQATPIQQEAVQIAAGGDYSLALKDGGSVWAWGRNNHGQLGDGTTTNKSAPVQVPGMSQVTMVAAGFYHSLALKDDGSVWAWGYNAHGELGNGNTINKSIPEQVSELSQIIIIAARYYHSLALKNDGSVWTWGYNAHGQLGDGSTTNKARPVQVSGLSQVTMVAAGYHHSLALKDDGSVWTWGYNAQGQLGDGNTTNKVSPVQVSGLSQVSMIAAGCYHSLALKDNGSIWTWGDNFYGQLGNGSIANKSSPVQVNGLSHTTMIASGAHHILALKEDCSVWAWGRNTSGQLGDGNTTNKSSPVQVTGLSNLTMIAVGHSHSLALKDNCSIWVWGSNSRGQLGHNSPTYFPEPVLSELQFISKTFTTSQNTTINIPVINVAQKNITFSFSTTDDTAIAGTDYLATSGNLTFLSNETQKDIQITILNNPDSDQDKTFVLNLDASNDVFLNDGSQAIISISDSHAVNSPYTQTFSQNMPASGWTYYSSTPNGRIQQTAGRLRMDTDTDQVQNLNEAILHIDLSYSVNVQLRFFQKSIASDTCTAMTGIYTSHFNGDGLSLSTDGHTWYRIMDSSDLATDALGKNYAFNLSATASAIQANHDEHFHLNQFVQIKFQQYGNRKYPSGGREWDDILVTSDFRNGHVGNDRPIISISHPESIIMNEDMTYTKVAITVSDTETADENLQLTAISSNPVLFPVDASHFKFGGSQGERTLHITPALQQSGSATITLVVSDEKGLTETTAIDVFVIDVNDHPHNLLPEIITIIEDIPTFFTASVSDIDGYSVHVVFQSDAGEIVLANKNGLIEYEQTMHQLSFTGTLADVNKAMEQINFLPSDNVFGSYSVTMITNDLGNSGCFGEKIDRDVMAICIKGVNDPPAISYTPKNFIDEDNALTLYARITDIDAGSNPLLLSISVVNGTIRLNQSSGLTPALPDTFSSLVSTSGSITDINKALDGFIFIPTTDFFGHAGITITVNDQGYAINNGKQGVCTSDQVYIPITVISFNDSPEIHSIGLLATKENHPLTITSLFISDADAMTYPLKVSLLTEPDGELCLSSNSGLSIVQGNDFSPAMSFIGSIDDINHALNGLVYSSPTSTGLRMITVTVNDLGNTGTGGTNSISKVIKIRILSENDPPINHFPPVIRMNENESLNIHSISVSDADAGSESLYVTMTSQNVYLTLRINHNLFLVSGSTTASQSMSFKGSQSDINAALDSLMISTTNNYTGVASLTITTNDLGHYGDHYIPNSVTDTIPISINAKPVAFDAYFLTTENQELNAMLDSFDTDGTILAYTIVSHPEKGIVNINNNGNFNYIPDLNQFGNDTFEYVVYDDNNARSNIASVNIKITNINFPLVANSKDVTLDEDKYIYIKLVTSDPDNDHLTYHIVNYPSHGEINQITNTVLYTPDLHYFGPDGFDYKVNDGHQDSNTASIMITVYPVDDPPIAHNSHIRTTENMPVDITLTGYSPDQKPLTFQITDAPTHGTLSQSTSYLTYTPDTDFNGTDALMFIVNDGTADSNPATISITVDRSDTYALSLLGSGYGTIKMNSTSVLLPWESRFQADAQICFEAVPDADWQFINWTGDLESNENPVCVILNKNKSITANLAIKTFELSIQGNETVTVNAEQHNLPFSQYFDIHTPIVIYNASDRFNCWEGDIHTIQNPYEFTIQSNMALTANVYPVPDWQTEIHVNRWLDNPDITQHSSVFIGTASQAYTKKAADLPDSHSCDIIVLNNQTSAAMNKEIHQNNHDTYQWIISVNPRGNVGASYLEETASLSWDATTLSPKGQYSLQNNTGEIVISDMRLITAYDVSDTSYTSFRIIWESQESFDFHLKQGWNLIALPLTPSTTALNHLFPDYEAAYEYKNGAYLSVSHMTPGKGYWLKVPSDKVYSISGQAFQLTDIDLSEGWQLIGGSHEEMTLDLEMSIKVIFRYVDGKYEQAFSLMPGWGYWVKKGMEENQ